MDPVGWQSGWSGYWHPGVGCVNMTPMPLPRSLRAVTAAAIGLALVPVVACTPDDDDAG